MALAREFHWDWNQDTSKMLRAAKILSSHGLREAVEIAIAGASHERGEYCCIYCQDILTTLLGEGETLSRESRFAKVAKLANDAQTLNLKEEEKQARPASEVVSVI